MNIHDPIADMLTRIRNAQSVAKKTVSMPHSKLKQAIASVLEEEGYITGFEKSKNEEGHLDLTIQLKYHDGKPVIATLERVSRPSLRIYKSLKDLPTFKNNLGVVVVSTSKGVMTAAVARQQGLGGEILCYVS